jgi:hypothetical protein
MAPLALSLEISKICTNCSKNRKCRTNFVGDFVKKNLFTGLD